MSKKKYSKEDASLETLLDLDGGVFPMDIRISESAHVGFLGSCG
jgi:hypothetical protein